MPPVENPTARDTNAGRSLLIPGPGGVARRLWSVYGGYALGFVSLFMIWQLASLYVVSSVLFPPPTVVFSKGLLLVRNGVLLEHLAASMQRILAGFIAGSLLGIPIGLAMGSFRLRVVDVPARGGLLCFAALRYCQLIGSAQMTTPLRMISGPRARFTESNAA